jgi:hypothetical protein
VITKFTKELDDLTTLVHHKKAHESLKHFKKQLHEACARYGTNESMELTQCIAQFCQEYEQAVTDYRQSKEIYLLLRQNGMSRIAIDTLFDHFHKEIVSSITYSLSPQIEEQELDTANFFDTIKAKFTHIKHQIPLIEEINSSNNEEES